MKSYRTLLFCGALAWALLAACTREGPATPTARVSVQRVADEHLLRVTWELPEPARALIFTRGSAFRNGQWNPHATGLHFTRKAGHDVLESDKPTQVFAVDIKEALTEIPGDYPLISLFSDGGLVFYTGHLATSWMSCLAECSEDDVAAQAANPLPADLTMIPAWGESVITSGRTSTNQPLPIGAPPLGAMVYFGHQTLSPGPGYNVIADPKLPAWVLMDFQDVFPQVIDLYTRRLGIPLPSQPTVFIPFLASGNRSFNSSYSGSVVGDNVVLGLFGQRWNTRDDDATQDLRILTAHESFHLWNAWLFHSAARPGGQWLHEGSADAFAYLALRELGLVTDQGFADLQTQALNRCMVGLTDVALPDSLKWSWDARNFYDCGSVIESVLSQSLQATGSDLWSFWTELFHRAGKTGSYYSPDEFFRMVGERVPSVAVNAQLQSLTAGGVHGLTTSVLAPNANASESSATADLESFFSSLYSAAGMQVTASDHDWPAWYAKWVASRALSMALAADCGDAGGYFMTEADGAHLVGGPSCQFLRIDQEIKSLAGYTLWDQGVQAYDAIQTSCQTSTRLQMTSASGDAIGGPCPRLPSRPRFLQLTTQ